VSRDAGPAQALPRRTTGRDLPAQTPLPGRPAQQAIAPRDRLGHRAGLDLNVSRVASSSERSPRH
jgi:hypothetical protein